MRACEIDRSEHDVLDAAGSAPAHELGDGAIRFSTTPQLGGDAYVLEFHPNDRGGARARFTWLFGHWRTGWDKEGRWTFDVSPGVYRNLVETVDDATIRLRPHPGPMDPNEPEERIICMDGPGFLTERVRGNQVLSMTGFCPYSLDPLEEHPHRAVEAAMLNIICPRFRTEFNPGDGLGQKCLRRARQMRRARG